MSMSQRPQFVYLYDGTFPGFLTCVFEIYARDEEPACFSGFDDPRTALWPERAVETDREKAERVYRSLSRKVSPEVQKWVRHGFLTCAPEKERRLYDFIRLAYRAGPAVVRDLTDSRVAPLHTALLHLWKEAHLFQGFVRFSDQGGVLCGQITPKTGSSPCCGPTSAPGTPESGSSSTTAHTGRRCFTSRGGGPLYRWRRFVPARRGRRSWITAGYGGGSTIPSPSRDAIIPSAV